MNPDQSNAKDDPGDETLRRYRFQATYAAVMSLGMLEDIGANTDFQEIFCEHHEDILVKKLNGKFIGVQVKTQDLSRGAFTSGDEAINKTLSRFVSLSLNFPDSFERFIIATNSGFSNEKKPSSLVYIIDEIKKTTGSLDLKVIAWIQKKARKYKCSEGDLITVLQKTMLIPDISSLKTIHLKLISVLNQIEKFRDRTLSELDFIANELVMHHLSASSLKITNPLNLYFAFCADPDDEETKEKINGKRITKENIEQFILKHADDKISIELKDKLERKGTLSSEKLTTKFDVGGISYENLALMKDNKYSMEQKLVKWMYKWGELKTTQRYNQVKSIVQGECQLAYDKSYKKGNILTWKSKFGTEMLISLRDSLKYRYSTDKESFFDCIPEHLYGMAGILTEECKVWWSEKFKI